MRKTCTPGSDRGVGRRLSVPTGPNLIGDVKYATRQHPLERRLRRSVRSAHTTASPRLGDQLHRRLEEVHIQPHRPIQLGQLTIGALAFEAIVANKLPHHRAIFLFDLCELRDYADRRAFTPRRAQCRCLMQSA